MKKYLSEYREGTNCKYSYNFKNTIISTVCHKLKQPLFGFSNRMKTLILASWCYNFYPTSFRFLLSLTIELIFLLYLFEYVDIKILLRDQFMGWFILSDNKRLTSVMSPKKPILSYLIIFFYYGQLICPYNYVQY